MSIAATPTPDSAGVVPFTASVMPEREQLGGKGASLVSMVQLGLPVPPGFILGTAVGRAWLRDGRLPAELAAKIDVQIEGLEHALAQRLGDPGAPLLVSVRSGAPVSMPGMMDTVLNVGLNEDVTQRLASRTGDARFAWGSFERLLHTYASVVRGVSPAQVEDALLDVEPDGDDDAAPARGAVALLLSLIEQHGEPFPPEPRQQVLECVQAVFRSWNSPRAKAYRDHRGIDHGIGTAAIIQSMVFGNRGEDSGSGVAFSRDPSTGEPGPYGDILFNAQGEDVVAGTSDPDPLERLAERLPAVHVQLCEILTKLERHSRDLVECEFTIEQGRFWVLQFRPAQRSGRAAVRCAVDLVDEGIIDEATAAGLVSEEQLEAAGAPQFSGPPADGDILARGCPASPGASVGHAVFDASRAQQLKESGEEVILVRPTTAPSDIHGFIASAGIVTGRGGRTSHAAVVARGMGRPAVCGVGEVRIASDRRSATIAGVPVREGDVLAVDGDRGLVMSTPPPLEGGGTHPRLSRLMEWRQRV